MRLTVFKMYTAKGVGVFFMHGSCITIFFVIRKQHATTRADFFCRVLGVKYLLKRLEDNFDCSLSKDLTCHFEMDVVI